MTVTQLVILGSLDRLGQASGYDITQELHRMRISNWADVKMSAIYQAIKQLEKDHAIAVVGHARVGKFPQKTLYQLTQVGRDRFDQLQAEAFLGLYPRFYGFKLALKFNVRRSAADIRLFAAQALAVIDGELAKMDAYLSQLDPTSAQYQTDRFFIGHDQLLFAAEKQWILACLDQLDRGHLADIT